MGHGLEHRSKSHLFILWTVLPESNEQSCVLCVSCLLPQQCNWLHGYAIPAVSKAEFMSELDPYITIAIAAEKWRAWYLIRKAMLNSCPWCYNRLQGKVTWSCNSYGNWAITPTKGSQRPFELNFSVDGSRSYCQKPTRFRYLPLF